MEKLIGLKKRIRLNENDRRILMTYSDFLVTEVVSSKNKTKNVK